jgi:hypothetical protein
MKFMGHMVRTTLAAVMAISTSVLWEILSETGSAGTGPDDRERQKGRHSYIDTCMARVNAVG